MTHWINLDLRLYPQQLSSGVLLLVVPPLERITNQLLAQCWCNPQMEFCHLIYIPQFCPCDTPETSQNGLSLFIIFAGRDWRALQERVVPTFFFPWGQGESVRSCDRFESLSKPVQVGVKQSPGCPSCQPQTQLSWCCSAVSGGQDGLCFTQANLRPTSEHSFTLSPFSRSLHCINTFLTKMQPFILFSI